MWHIDAQRKFGCSNNRSTVSSIRTDCVCVCVQYGSRNIHFRFSLFAVAVNIPYNFVTSVLNHYGLNQCDNAPSLKPTQLTSLLHDIYFAAEKCGQFSQSVDFNLERCTAMLTNLLWSIFDPYVFVCAKWGQDVSFIFRFTCFRRHRTIPISLLEFKQLMLIMCNTQTFEQMILEEFLIVADHNRCVNRFRFESLLKVISKVFLFLGESVHYGWHLVTNWVQQCFQQVNWMNGTSASTILIIIYAFLFLPAKQCPGIIGLDEYQFTCLWQNQAIHFANYSNVLALVQRIKESQNILHDVQCVACKAAPITGIRFKCQQCRKLSLCFECFCKGYTNARHEISHRMYEMSTIVSSPYHLHFIRYIIDDVFDFSEFSANQIE